MSEKAMGRSRALNWTDLAGAMSKDAHDYVRIGTTSILSRARSKKPARDFPVRLTRVEMVRGDRESKRDGEETFRIQDRLKLTNRWEREGGGRTVRLTECPGSAP